MLLVVKMKKSFQTWITRLGKVEVKKMLEPYTKVPNYVDDATYYSDWGDPREFTLGDMGVGECAGEIVSLFSINVSKAEGTAFEALVALEENKYVEADQNAYQAMLLAAKALVLNQNLNVGDDPNNIVKEFRTHFYDTEIFFDKYAGGKFAQYLFRRHENPKATPDKESSQRLIEEANLFIEAAHACDARIASAGASGVL